MSYLITLRKKLRTVAREVFLHDPYFEHIKCIQTNKHARIFLRRIIKCAKGSSFNWKILLEQLARLIRVSRTTFVQWFRYNTPSPVTFRRARWFLNEMIRLNAEEDLRPLGVLEDLNVEEKPIKWPNKRTKAIWKQRIEAMREDYRNQGPKIKNETEANELIQCMQSGYASSSSSENGSRRDSFGEVPIEERTVKEVPSESTESPGLNGPPDIITYEQFLDGFRKILIVSDKSDGINNDNEILFSGIYDLSGQKLCMGDGDSKH